jgi:hypothetical protein
MAVLLIVVVVALLVALAVIAWLLQRQRRSRALQDQFGPEYGRTVHAVGSRDRAEQELTRRQERVERLQLRPLSPDDQQRFAAEWRTAQAQFVDDPRGATGKADQLIGAVMERRGYPVGDFEARAADLSVDYPTVVSNYRAAHTIALNAERGRAGTEDLRQALVHYRALFEELVGTPQTAATEARQ